MIKSNYKIKFLKILNKYLKSKKINLVFLGDQNNLKISKNSDIDLFLDFNQNVDFLKAIKIFSRKYKYKICNIMQYEVNSFYIVFAKISKNEIYFLSIDVCNNYYFKNRLIINLKRKKKFFEKSKVIKGLNILNDYYQFKYYFIKKILKNDFNSSSLKYLNKLFLKNTEKIKFFFDHFFKKEISKKIIQGLKENKTLFFNNYNEQLKSKIYEKKRVKFFDFIYNIKRIFFRIINPTGIKIVFLGVDGSGKSTLINILNNDYQSNTNGFGYLFRNISNYHLSVLKSLQKGKPIKNPHSKKNYNFFISFIKFIYLSILQTVESFYLRINLIFSTLVIFDRYYYDFSIDIKRYRLSDNALILLLFKRFNFLFKPDITFYINSNPIVISKRKTELPLQKIQELNKKYIHFIKNNNNSYIVANNNYEEKKAIYKIKFHIIKYLNKKIILKLKKIT